MILEKKVWEGWQLDDLRKRSVELRWRLNFILILDNLFDTFKMPFHYAPYKATMVNPDIENKEYYTKKI